MGLLDKLWDDTLAGPQPDSGLGRLRKYNTFSFRSNMINKGESEGGELARSYSENMAAEENVAEPPTPPPRVTRSIMIVRPAGYMSPSSGSPLASPAGSTPPVSPFSGGKEPFRFRRRSASDAHEKPRGDAGAGSSTSPYDV